MSHGTSDRTMPPPAVESPDVIAWRKRRLEQAGFDAPLAARFGADPRVDVHAILDLVDRGCPAPLAARIHAPLDADSGEPR
jgi:hypothetical protein